MTAYRLPGSMHSSLLRSIGLKACAALALGLVSLAAAAPTAALAQTVLRMDEVPPAHSDPAQAGSTIDSILFYNLYDTLFLPGPGGKGYVPQLAESYEVDGNVVTIKLKSGVKFQSGNPLTADDVNFSLNRLVTMGQGWSPLFRGWIEKTEALDELTTRITLKAPYAPFQAALFRLAIVDSKTIMANLADGKYGEFKDYGNAYLLAHSAGTGSYTLVEQSATAGSVLEKNPNYFLPVPAAAPDQVRISYALEGATQLALMRRGELDILTVWASPETKRSALKLPGVRIGSESGIAKSLLFFNTKKAPLDDIHCRKALSAAVDIDALTGMVNLSADIPGTRPANGPLLEGMMGYDPSAPATTRDMDKAKAELALCKYKPGDYEIEISWIAEVPLEERVSLLLQSNWAELGFKSNIVRYPFSSYIQASTAAASTPHVSQLNFNARTPDPDSVLYTLYHSNSAGLFTGATWLQDPEIDALIDKGRSTFDDAERTKIYDELSKKITDGASTVFAYDMVNNLPMSDRVSVPMLEDPARNAKILGLNFIFRAMEMK